MGLLSPLTSGAMSWITERNISQQERDRLMTGMPPLNSAGYDPWGFSPEVALAALAAVRPLYDDYFRCETVNIDKVPAGRVMLIANHGGQLPLDGMLLSVSMALHATPPRLVRGMVERWAPSLPFVSTLFARSGQVTGDPANCRSLLNHDQAVMVFPEGVRGSGKTIWHRYQLQHFGTGFMRMALETNTPIVPVGIIGCEETYPSIYDAKPLAKLFGAPYAPVTPFFPFLGPIGALPLPMKVRLHFGEPLHFDGDFDGAEGELAEQVKVVTDELQKLIDDGVRQRGRNYF